MLKFNSFAIGTLILAACGSPPSTNPPPTFPCVAVVALFEGNATITTTVDCPVGRTVALFSKVFDGSALVDSARQEDAACGATTLTTFKTAATLSRAEITFSLTTGESGTCALRVPALR
jgi:hypothetical protein